MLQAFGRLSQAVDFKLDACQAQPRPQVAGHHDQFGIDIRSCKPQRLGSKLMKLPVAASLWALVSKHRSHVIQALATVVKHGVFHDSAHHAGGVLRPQGQCLTVQAILERVHLFFDDIGDLTQTTHKQGSRLNNGCTHVAIAVGHHQVAQLLLQPFPACGLRRENVIHAFDGRNFVCHKVTHAPESVARAKSLLNVSLDHRLKVVGNVAAP